MEKSPNKKWSSFEEMYNDLKNSDYYKNSVKKSTSNSIQNIIKDIEIAQTGKDFFDCTCKISAMFDSLDDGSLQEIYRKTNIYVLILNAVLRNKSFIGATSEIVGRNKKINDLKNNRGDLEKLILLNTALSLAFFGIALNYQSINANSIEFLRKNTNDLIKNIFVKHPHGVADFINICYLFEKISWDNRLHYNENYQAKFPVRLKDNFLFSNLKNSRSFAGITFTSLVIRPAIENRFKKIISQSNNEKFSISFALDDIFNLANDVDEKIKHYYRNASSDISSFFDIFIKSNEKNLVYCLKNFCLGFHFQGKNKKFFEIILEKLQKLPELKQNFINYTNQNFKAFNNKISSEDDQWTNKLFLTSIKTISVLDEVKNASDSRWIVNVAIHEFHQWIVEIHEILNKYYIEDDWEKIKDYTLQESERVEWKSSFFTPLEQEYRDESSENAISKKIFEKILKSVLGMLNTDGGILIVGLIENPDSIKRNELKEFLMGKNGVSFFDINYELKKYGKTLDGVRLQILDNLRQITDSSPDNFNNLIEFEPIILRDENHVISVIKIIVQKSTKFFYNVKKERNSLWISLTKRAQGQNVDVDIRDYL